MRTDAVRQPKLRIRQFLRSILSQIGLQSGVDYVVTSNSLRIRHLKNVTGRILVTLEENFPVFCFYWASPRLLVWF